MLTAHSNTSDLPGAAMALSQSGDALFFDVVSPRPEVRTKIAALGLFGLLSIGDHYMRHHLMIAQGLHH